MKSNRKLSGWNYAIFYLASCHAPSHWGESLAEDVACKGMPLDGSGLSVAKSVGVQRGGGIRVLMVDRLEIPTARNFWRPPCILICSDQIWLASHSAIRS